MIYLFLVLLTIFFTSRVDLMYENLTGALMLEKYHGIIVCYIIICALFFAYKVFFIYKKINMTKTFYRPVIVISALMMIIGALSPYTINGQDIYSYLHVYCSMISCLSFLILLWVYTRLLSIHYSNIYHHIHWFYDLALQFLAILTIVFTKVNGYIEILFIMVVCIYLYMIEKDFHELTKSHK